MRVVIQRVTRASVEVDGQIVGKIGKGLVLLVGITHTDTKKDAEYLVRKCVGARLWPDKETGSKPWASSAVDNGYEVLVISQFTLYGLMKKAYKPDFHQAMPPTPAKALYDECVCMFKKEMGEDKVQCGQFGAMMAVDLVNDGPVTISLDSADWQDPSAQKEERFAANDAKKKNEHEKAEEKKTDKKKEKVKVEKTDTPADSGASAEKKQTQIPDQPAVVEAKAEGA